MELFQEVKLLEGTKLVEGTIADEKLAATAGLVRELLLQLGEDPQREGLLRTPERVARMYGELLAGYQMDEAELINGAIFESESDGLVVVRDIQFYSLCEHHLLPFMGKAHVAYLPDQKIIGLSKIPRLVEMYARRLQIQERLTGQIAQSLWSWLQPQGVAVLVAGSHLCARMRGVKKEEARMLTSSRLGRIKSDESLFQNFLSQLAVRRAEADGF